jgi:hypothetical protein
VQVFSDCRDEWEPLVEEFRSDLEVSLLPPDQPGQPRTPELQLTCSTLNLNLSSRALETLLPVMREWQAATAGQPASSASLPSAAGYGVSCIANETGQPLLYALLRPTAEPEVTSAPALTSSTTVLDSNPALARASMLRKVGASVANLHVTGELASYGLAAREAQLGRLDESQPPRELRADEEHPLPALDADLRSRPRAASRQLAPLVSVLFPATYYPTLHRLPVHKARSAARTRC